MDNNVEQWKKDDKIPIVDNMDSVSPSTFNKRKHSSQEKPRKFLRTGTHTVYEVEGVQEPKDVVQGGHQMEQSFTDALDLIAKDTTAPDSSTKQHNIYYLDNGVLVPIQSVDMPQTEATADMPSSPTEVTEVDHVLTQPRPDVVQSTTTTTAIEVEEQENKLDNNPTSEESSELGPHMLGLMPVGHPAMEPPASPPPVDHQVHQRHDPDKLEERVLAMEHELQALHHKHNLLQESHDKLTELVEAQNHLLACHTPPPPTKEALNTFAKPKEEPDFIELEESPEAPTSPITPTQAPVSPTPAFLNDKQIPIPNYHYKLPRKVTARDIIHLWEDGNNSIPPVKNWSPAQKMRVQSKLSRWKKIIDIFKGDCDNNIGVFEQRYSSDCGDLLPVTTILALHENQLSSEFLSKGFSNTKTNTIDLKPDMEPSMLSSEAETSGDDSMMQTEKTLPVDSVSMISTPGTTNRYVLPRKVTARDVVQLWDDGCEDFPAISSWTKAQKIGQETKIFRWKKIVDLFKKDCRSDWDLFTERYSNEKGELLPLATILAKHEAMYAQEHPTNTMKTESIEETPTNATTPTNPHETLTTPIKTEWSKPRNPDSITLPRKVTAFEVVRYWTEGSDTFGPVKDWTRAQKTGQETKISRWKKIYEIFRYQCYRDWDEFCRRYTNPRGELLPIATILAKYEAENPAGAPSYHMHVRGETQSPELQIPGSDGDQTPIGLESLPLADIIVSINEDGQYVLPKKLRTVDALSLWEYGNEEVPPIKSWTEGQVTQKSLVESIRKVVQIFEQDCGGRYRRFLERFSDTDGKLLPIIGIVYSHQSRKYSPHFTVYEKSIKQSRSKGEQYELPKRVSAKEIVWLWENGCIDFPPVKAWSSAQKLPYTTKLSRWRKIVDIFRTKCDGDWRVYESKYSNASGELLAISTVIAMQEESSNDSYVSMIKKSSNSPEPSKRKLWSTPLMNVVKAEKPGGQSEDDVTKREGKFDEASPGSADEEFHLPRKVSAIDIINFWEKGFNSAPPVAEWSPLQKFSQRSKISRWSKIYDIYKNHCHGDIAQFQKLYSDKDGHVLPATTIISMYESRVDGDVCNGNTMAEVQSPGSLRSPVVRRYVLPRKVDAKDIVRLWTQGNDEFPPIQSWTKADKIGQETKIFRWKKVVEIFMNHCNEDWAVFEDLFSNEYGELLPTSVIISRFETMCSKV